MRARGHAHGDIALVVSLYVVAVLVYGLLSHGIAVPTIFPDEFTYGHIAQSIAAGDGVSWRGASKDLRSLLYVLAIAPSWIVDSGHGAYVLAKLENAAMASLVVVPTWLLARRALGPRLALVPALLSLAGTWMLTTGYLLSESLAYPLAAGSLAAMVACLWRPRSRWWIAALLLAAAAAYARLQLVALVPIFAGALLIDAARHGRSAVRARLVERRVPLLVTGGIALVALIVGLSSSSALGIYASVRHFSPGLGDVLGASGQHALAIIVFAGFVPVAAALALALSPANWRDDDTGPVLAVLVCAIVVFVLQAGWFGAGFELKWDIERYVAYVAPLVLVAMALAPGRITWPLAGVSVVALATALLLTDAPRNVVEQRAVLASTHRLGQLVSAFGDHPGLGLAVAGLLLGAGGMALLVGLGRISAERSLLGAGAIVLVVLLVQSQASWHNERAIASYQRQREAADFEWVDKHARGTVGIVNTNFDNPGLYVTELFNEKIRGRYNLRPGLQVTGPVCEVRVAVTGALRGANGCTPPPWLLLETSFIRPTFQNQRVVATNPPNSRLITVPAAGAPRLLSLVEIPCAEPGTPFYGANRTTAPCSGHMSVQTWSDRPGTLVMRWKGGAAQHYGRPLGDTGDAATYSFPPGETQTLRFPVSEGQSTVELQLDWGSSETAPTLESVQLSRGGEVTPLLY